jgi:teichuronic acid biosynthesis glycosyltransferase TuaG
VDIKNTGLVSVIIPNYNSQKYITETINSILLQSYENIEVIIVDDFSTDQSLDIIKEFQLKDARVRLFSLKKNSGRPAIPRNYGIEKSKGKFIAFMDSDDIWHRDKLSTQLEVMARFSVDFCCTSSINFVNYCEISKKLFVCKNEVSFKKITHDNLLFKNTIPNSSVIILRKKLADFRFNEDVRYKAVEDYHLWLRLLQHGLSAIKLDQNLLYYRISETSISQYKFQMLKKVFLLLGEYKVNGKYLGINRYMYVVSYVFFSGIRVLRKRI